MAHQFSRFTIAFFACWIASCVREASPTQRYVTALEEDDPRAAYMLLSPAVKRELSYVQFKAQWQDLSAERMEQLRELQSGMFPQKREFQFEDGRRATLIRQSASAPWQIATPFFGGGPDTPIRLLEKTYAHLRNPFIAELGALFSRNHGFTGTIHEMTEVLGVAVADPKRVALWSNEKNATANWTALGKTVLVRMVFEQEWKIEDFRWEARQEATSGLP